MQIKIMKYPFHGMETARQRIGLLYMIMIQTILYLTILFLPIC